MLDIDWNRHKREMEDFTTKELQERIIREVYAGEKLELANFVLEEKIRVEEKEKLGQNLILSERNVRAAEGLVIATRWLVWATVGLMLVGILPYVGKIIKYFIK